MADGVEVWVTEAVRRNGSSDEGFSCERCADVPVIYGGKGFGLSPAGIASNMARTNVIVKTSIIRRFLAGKGC